MTAAIQEEAASLFRRFPQVRTMETMLSGALHVNVYVPPEASCRRPEEVLGEARSRCQALLERIGGANPMIVELTIDDVMDTQLGQVVGR
jgi:hypothetical protein